MSGPDAASSPADRPGDVPPDVPPEASPEASPETLLARAAARGRAALRPYAGDVTPAEAWALLRAGAATLVDVRTHAEWTFVGRVEGVPLVEWRLLGAQQPRADFLDRLAEQVAPERPVMFLCRSGVRSQAAAQAATAAGWPNALNVLEGFEGDQDALGRRGTVGGWRHAGLPWTQS
jgi:rhodanese-related sulfurtransferase